MDKMVDGSDVICKITDLKYYELLEHKMIDDLSKLILKGKYKRRSFMETSSAYQITKSAINQTDYQDVEKTHRCGGRLCCKQGKGRKKVSHLF